MATASAIGSRDTLSTYSRHRQIRRTLSTISTIDSTFTSTIDSTFTSTFTSTSTQASHMHHTCIDKHQQTQPHPSTSYRHINRHPHPHRQTSHLDTHFTDFNSSNKPTLHPQLHPPLNSTHPHHTNDSAWVHTLPPRDGPGSRCCRDLLGLAGSGGCVRPFAPSTLESSAVESDVDTACESARHLDFACLPACRVRACPRLTAGERVDDVMHRHPDAWTPPSHAPYPHTRR